MIRMPRRIAAFLALLLVAAVGLTGCGGSKAPSSSSGTTEQPKKEEPAKPKTMVLAYSDGGTTVDPAMANDLTSDTLTLAVYDTLVQFGVKEEGGKQVADTVNIKPMLAESFTPSADGKSYTFKLRKAKFQNGDPVTAEAVRWSYERLYNIGASGKFLFQTAGIKDPSSIKVIDEQTIQINLEAQTPTFLQVLALYNWAVLNPKIGQEKGNDWLAKNAEGTGSGPFKLVSWNPATEAVLEANKDYWAGAPKVDKMVIKFIKEDSNRLMLLQSGDADLAIEIPPKDVTSLQANQNLVVRSDASGRILYFLLNTAVKPFDNKKVRQAVSYAIPYKDLTDKVMYGQAKQAKSPLPSFMPMYDGSFWKYDTNLDKAKQLLAEAGLPNGFEFTFLLGSGFSDWEQDAVLIQDSLAKIGVKMNIQRMQRSEFLQVIKKQDTPAFISKWTSFVNDPAYHLGFLLEGKGSSNYGKYVNPEVDKRLAEAAKLMDPAKRAGLYKEAQQMIVDDAPWIFLYEYNRVVTMNKNVKGYVFFQDELIRPYLLSK
ncbi:MAG TPA: ABC transporter substrate-binding protein [Symbiobacteriaceae bacterium]|nr:ABC transporter substrate-binding protein [Symbiobacteriaceae bacterium]